MNRQSAKPNTNPQRVRSFLYSAAIIFAIVSQIGCATSRRWSGGGSTGCSTCGLTNEISARSGVAAASSCGSKDLVLPDDIEQGTELSLGTAITTALDNNDGFQATLAQLGMADGDYLQSTLLTNPQFATFFPVGVKQWEWTLFVPIEVVLLRPERVDLADKDRERVAHQLVQTGLMLVRDVTVAYTNLALATEQHLLALETLQIRVDLKELTEKRLEDGDIAELEAIQTRVDALNAQANADLLEQNINVTREQLAMLMGIPEQADRLFAMTVPECHAPVQTIDELIAHATANRPDLQAAQWAVAAAQRRLALARKAFWRFDGVADYNGSGDDGPEVGPGIRFDIPIFNKNEGGVKRACAELEAAEYNRDQLKDQIVNQVRLSNTQIQQASNNFNALDTKVLPTLNEALEIATKGFEDGGTSYLLVLQTTSQYVDVKSRMLDQAAARCRASAELELSCGGRLEIDGTFVNEQSLMSLAEPIGNENEIPNK